MKLSDLKSIRTIPCPAHDVLPGSLGWVKRTDSGEVCHERACLLSIQRAGKQGHLAVLQLDNGRSVRVRLSAFRLQLITHPMWN
jgi:hypothetical protein